MNKEDFIKECSVRGVCRKEYARRFVRSFTDDYDFSESDFEEAYRFEDRCIFYENTNRNLHMYENALSTKQFKYE